MKNRPEQPNLQHGVHVLIKSDGRDLPALTGASAIATEVDDVLTQIEADLGNDLSAAQRELLRSCRLPMLVLRLSEAYLVRNDLVDKRGRPRGLLRIAGSYANVLRHALTELGLKRIPRQIDSVESIAAEIAEEKRNDENQS